MKVDFQIFWGLQHFGTNPQLRGVSFQPGRYRKNFDHCVTQLKKKRDDLKSILNAALSTSADWDDGDEMEMGEIQTDSDSEANEEEDHDNRQEKEQISNDNF